MRKSLILFPALFAFIFGCSSSEPDKYNLITKQDRKMMASVCKCVEPLTPYLKKMMNTKDSVEAMGYADSIKIVSEGMDSCLKNISYFETKSFSDEKYTKQFVEYMKEKHPDCLPLFLGTKSEGEIK